jgi:hypothetical protein
MLSLKNRKQIDPKISIYIKEQTNKSMEKYLRVLLTNPKLTESILSKTNRKIYHNQICLNIW